MRIVAGVAGGRRLRGPVGLDTRPMMDRVREAVFSSLGEAVGAATVLDLYAGSGSIGLEALSRGAESVVFVEHDRRAVAVLRANIEAVGLGGDVIVDDVEAFLARDSTQYGLAFVDPPYRLSLPSLENVLRLVVSHLVGDAPVVIHRRRGAEWPDVPGLSQVSRRRYGDAEILRMVKEEM